MAGSYGGEQLLSPETVRLFTTMKSSISRRGLGFDKPDPQQQLSPTSPATPVEVYGHTGFTGTSFWIDPVNNMIYIFLSNRKPFHALQPFLYAEHRTGPGGDLPGHTDQFTHHTPIVTRDDAKGYQEQPVGCRHRKNNP